MDNPLKLTLIIIAALVVVVIFLVVLLLGQKNKPNNIKPTRSKKVEVEIIDENGNVIEPKKVNKVYTLRRTSRTIVVQMSLLLSIALTALEWIFFRDYFQTWQILLFNVSTILLVNAFYDFKNRNLRNVLIITALVIIKIALLPLTKGVFSTIILGAFIVGGIAILIYFAVKVGIPVIIASTSVVISVLMTIVGFIFLLLFGGPLFVLLAIGAFFAAVIFVIYAVISAVLSLLNIK